ncbi:hypothetical protein ACQEVF_54185 [Nonomuraea polychroma]|uniref:hypothetical protein n=1 Tax=Nonomuraea polychroma TaxID=46176 RepID=UPI003D8BA036
MSGDELKVPSQRADEPSDQHAGERADERADQHADERADERTDPYADERAGDVGQRADETNEAPHGGEPGAVGQADEEPGGQTRGDLADEDELARGEQTTTPVPGAPAAPVPGAVAAPVPGAVPEDETAYRDPYARTGGDMLAEPEPGPEPEPEPEPESAHAPEHAAPEDVVLFDQDPAQVQARWRDLQAAFVDDPGEAVRRADGLVGEVVESLTSSLTSRTNALREHWKDAESSDTEQLRLALRDYRNVLERLLALSGTQQGTQTTSQASGHQTEGSR